VELASTYCICPNNQKAVQW